MMAEILDAAIITLDGSTADTVQCILDYDWEGNLYETEDGVPVTVTTFYLDEEIDLLVQVPPGYSVVNVKTSTGNTITQFPLVQRTVEVRDKFFEDTEETGLTWYPNSNPTILSDHMALGVPVLTVEDNKVTCNQAPVVLDFDYTITAYSFSVNHPSSVELEDDEVFPMGLVVEVIKG